MPVPSIEAVGRWESRQLSRAFTACQRSATIADARRETLPAFCAGVDDGRRPAL